jgi:hypothetical protein
LSIVASIHIADAQTAKQAQDAIRDILYLYRDLVAYGGIVGDHDIGTFDPWLFLRADGDFVTEDDVKLLREGAAVAILCDLLDEMEQRGHDIDRFTRGVAAGEFDGLPVAKTAIEAGLLGGPVRLTAASGPVFDEYVAGYFATLGT